MHSYFVGCLGMTTVHTKMRWNSHLSWDALHELDEDNGHVYDVLLVGIIGYWFMSWVLNKEEWEWLFSLLPL